MEHQDFKTLYLRKSKPKPKQTHTFQKERGDVTDDTQKPFKKIGHDFKQALLKARQAKSMSQKDLAQKINVKPTVIQNYETGKVIPNGEIINKMNRVLGIKLPKCK